MHFTADFTVSNTFDGSSVLPMVPAPQPIEPGRFLFSASDLGVIDLRFGLPGGVAWTPLLLQSALLKSDSAGSAGHGVSVVDSDGNLAFGVVSLDGVSTAFADDRWIIPPGFRLRALGPSSGILRVHCYPLASVQDLAVAQVIVASGGGASPPTSVFGTEYQKAEDDGDTFTVSTTAWVEKLKLTTTSLVGGTYRIAWSYTWAHNNTSATEFLARVELDDTFGLAYHQEEPQDEGWEQRMPASGFKTIDLSAGVHTVDLDFASTSSAQASRIGNARLELYRVA